MKTPSAVRLPAGIWALGFVSLFMDVSSELIHSLLPVFMVGTLGASAFVLGLVEGAAEACALIVKVFSGVLSDYWGCAASHLANPGRESCNGCLKKSG